MYPIYTPDMNFAFIIMFFTLLDKLAPLKRYLFDKLAPLKKICSVDRPMGDWMTDDIRALKAKRRKNEVILR